MRNTLPLFVVLVSLSLAGCFGDGDEPSPRKETGSTKIEETIFGGEEPDINTAFRASWDPSVGILPYPNDILGFLANGTTDGSLNLTPSSFQPLVADLNQVDGFSTSARIQTNFSEPVSAASLTPASVFLLEVAVDPGTRAVVGLGDDAIIRLQTTGNPFLVQGVDYDVSVAPDSNSGGQTIQLKPILPLNEGAVQTLPGNEGRFNAYLMILMGGDNGITNGNGTAAVADTTFEQIKQGYLAGLIQIPDDPADIPVDDLTLEELLALFTAAQLATAEALGLNVADIISTSSFSTLNVSDVMETVSALAQPGDSAVQRAVTPLPLPLPGGGVLPAGTPVTTALVLTLLGVDPDAVPGEGDVYAGTITLPYYQAPAENPQDTSILTEYWVGNAGVNPLDPDSTVLSRFNPAPVKRADVTVPALIAIPNDNTDYAAALGGTAIKPPEGWPVVIFNHGITRNRMDMFAIAEPWTNSGFAVIAIDQPLHGIAVAPLDPTLPPAEIAAIIAENPEVLFRIPGVDERTFDVDLVTGATPGTPPDGVIDPSGVHFINLSSGLTSRDNSREAASSLITLTRTLPTIDIDADGTADFDGSRNYFQGISLGSITGTTYLGSDSTVVSATLGVGGGVLVDLLLDSFAFGPSIEAGLSAASPLLIPNTALYNNFLRDFQNIVDGGDPINFAAEAAARHAIHFIEVEGDLVVPNSASNRLAGAMGVTEVTAPGPNVDPAGWVGRVCFTEGSHGSQADPSSSPAATAEMTAETVVFSAGFPPLTLPGDGQTILIQDPSIIGDFAAGNCQAPNRPRFGT